MQIIGRKHLVLDEYTNEVAQVTATCPLCGVKDTHEVSLDGLYDWAVGKQLIQDVFPDMSSDDREQLITGICPDCWGED